jgi:formylglycine-generating enzyme required for sulfatase activity
VLVALTVAAWVALRSKRSDPLPAPTLNGAPAIPWWHGLSDEQAAEAKRLGLPAAFEEPTTGMRFVLIPGGTFTMGAPESESYRSGMEGPQHEVTLSPFYLSMHETTNAQFRRFQVDHASGAEFSHDAKPAVFVSHSEAVEFANWLSQRGDRGTKELYGLPTEAQWEYACRAGTKTRYAFGDDLTPDKANIAGVRRGTVAVGTYEANHWGLHDMHGNAWEWCEDDYHGTYERAPTDGSAWIDNPRAKSRITRGGAWSDAPVDARAAIRATTEQPGSRSLDIGFRLARGVTPK